MKKYQSLLFCLLCSYYLSGQSTDLFVFYENNELITLDVEKGVQQTLGANVWPKEEQLLKTDNIVYKDADLGLDFEFEQQFVSGLQSPYDSNVWLYAAGPLFGTTTQLFQYNTVSQKTDLILNAGEGPESEWVFIPIAYGANPNTIYLEAMNFNTQEEHLGVWEFNLKTRQFTQLDLQQNYMITPLIAPDRTQLYYTASTNKERDVIHGLADLVIAYDLNTEAETILYNSDENQVRLLGFHTTGDKLETTTLSLHYKNLAKQFLVPYYLPFELNSNWCVTRDGTPRPPASSLNNGGICFYSFNQHTYEALDFSNLNVSGGYYQEDIKAVASGTVVYAQDSGCACNYGNLVKILHDDGNYSYYAHLTTIAVSVGDCVGQGELVGTEGLTGAGCGNCTYAEHAHFEVRTSTASGTQIWVPFAEYGETPRQSDYVTSGNVEASCCASTLNITGTIPAGTQQAGTSITSTGVLNSGVSASFECSSIDLLPGFEAKTGSVFDGKDGGCQ